MKLKIAVKTNMLPSLYRHRIISLIKKALEISDIQYLKELYNQKRTKHFTFSIAPISYSKKMAKLQLNNKEIEIPVYYPTNSNTLLCNLYISSIDYPFITLVAHGIKKMKEFNFSGDYMYINNEKIMFHFDNVIILETPNIKNQVRLKTVNPILLNMANIERNKFIFFNQDNFENELNYIMDVKLKQARGYGLREKLCFTPIDMETVAIRHYISQNMLYMKGSIGIFDIKGNKEDIIDCIDMGFGIKTGQGFGMVKVC